MVPWLCVLLMAGCWAAWAGGAAGQSSYCSFTPQHTLCKSSGQGSRCGQQLQGRGVGAQEAAAILALHNQLRSRVAMGLEARGAPGPQPSAANMGVMVWDDELATVAQSHANQCTFEHECSDCRRVERFAVGQNLFISFQSNLDKRVQWGRAIRAWYDEVADFSPTTVDQFQFSAAVGHYTQMLWWSSGRVGCGFTMFREDGWWKKLYTCNYGPAGNILFSQMYKRGTPCSQCPRGTSCSLNYPGLCESSAGTGNGTTRRPSSTTPGLTTTISTTPSPLTTDNNDLDNTISLIPGADTKNIFTKFPGFNGLINLNSINPDDSALNTLITFFRSGRRPALLTAEPPSSLTTTPAPSTTTTTTSPSSPPTTLPAVNTSTTTTTTTTPLPPTTTSDTTTTSTTATFTTTTSLPQGPTFAPSLTTNQVGLGGFGIPTSPPVSTLIGAAVRPRPPSRRQEGEAGVEREMFVPFSGQQPKSSDLMPFLERAGMNTQVIRTTLLSNVQGIIRALPRGTRPIVLFRTSAGQLRELDPLTLAPLRRFSRSTTTRGPKTNTLDNALLACDLDVSPCEVTPVGGNWTIGNSDSEGRYAEALLSEGEGAQVVVEPLVKPPSSGAVCIALSHRRTLLPATDPINTNTTLPPLQVGVMPLGGEVTRRLVLGAPGMWEMSRVTFRNLKTSFLVMVTLGPASIPATVDLDAIMVTDGECCRSGRC